jgi:aminopeptidase N
MRLCVNYLFIAQNLLYFEGTMGLYKIHRLLFVFCFITWNSNALAQEKKDHGKLTPLRTCYDVTHYGIEVKVIPETRSIRGCNTISFKAVNGFKTLQLDYVKAMQIDSIVFQNKPLLFDRKNNTVLVHFPKTIMMGDHEKIKVYFNGKPQVAILPPWKGGFVWNKDANLNDWVGLACEGIGTYIWLPCKDHWSDEADSMDMYLSVPEGLTGVSNGQLVARKKIEMNYELFHWQVRNPINNYSININVGKYTEIRDTFYGIHQVPLNYYVLEDNRAKAIKHFQQVKGMLKAFENYFGAYPFYEDSYKLVETSYWGMEHQSCIAYGNHYMNNDYNFDFIIIHESGHEWFANSITAIDPADMWIHESFTTYSEALYVEYFYGKERANDYLVAQRKSIIAKHPMLGPRGEFYHGYTDNDIYYKGTWLLHTMRNAMNNDSLWFDAIHQLSEQFKHKIIQTEDIIAFFNTHTDYKWQLFFDQYLYKGPIPELVYKINLNRDGTQTVTYHFKNIVKGFRMPIKIYTSSDKKMFIWLTPNANKQTVVIPSNAVFKVATELFLVK